MVKTFNPSDIKINWGKLFPQEEKIPVFVDGIDSKYFTPLVKRAREYADIMHDGQKYGEFPYLKHLADTYKVFIELLLEPIVRTADKYNQSTFAMDLVLKYQPILCALWLHDVIEDTEAVKEDVIHHFGHTVADMVWAVTGEGANRKEKLQSIKDKIFEVPDAIIVKLCDRIANTRASSTVYYLSDAKGDGTSLFEMYVKEFPEFKKALGDICKDVIVVQKLWEYLETISKL